MPLYFVVAPGRLPTDQQNNAQKIRLSFSSVFLLLLVLQPLSAKAEHEGRNAPGRPPGCNLNGLLRFNIDFFNPAAAAGNDTA